MFMFRVFKLIITSKKYFTTVCRQFNMDARKIMQEQVCDKAILVTVMGREKWKFKEGKNSKEII